MNLPRNQVLGFATILSFSALSLFAQTLTVRPERTESMYTIGETARWIVETSDASKLSNPTYTLKVGGLDGAAATKLTFVDNKATIETTLSSSGWVLVDVAATGSTAGALKAQSGAVFGHQAITPVKPKPADFDSFWSTKIAELNAAPLTVELTDQNSPRADITYQTIKLSGYKGTSIQGQLARPKAPGKRPGMVIFQWAGVYPLESGWVSGHAAAGWLVLNTQAHDIKPIEPAAYYTELQNGALKDYYRIGNQDRETSYFLRMYLACYRAVEYLSQRDDWDGKTLVVMGASQGGLQAIVAASLHPKVTALLAQVPAGADQDGVDAGRSPGWPQWAYQAWDRDVNKVRTTARYFDAVNFIDSVKCPTLLGFGMIDTVVPPSSVLSLYNSVRAPRRLVVMPQADHVNNQQVYTNIQTEWLQALRDGGAPALTSMPLSDFVPQAAGRATNLSVLAPAGRGEETLIGGFVIKGEGFKTVLVRAAGPSLKQFSVGSPLEDPLLRVFDEKGALVGENDDWSLVDEATMKFVHAFEWPRGGKDAAAVLRLPPGAYTAQIQNRGQTAAPALLEVYDVSREKESYLYNISCRVNQNPDNPVILGFTLDGPAPVLVRNGGPSLKAFGVNSAASDTNLRIYDGQTIVAENDSWDPSLTDSFARLGAYSFGTSTKDSALGLSSPPLQITAHAKSVGTSGIGLVEVYLAK